MADPSLDDLDIISNRTYAENGYPVTDVIAAGWAAVGTAVRPKGYSGAPHARVAYNRVSCSSPRPVWQIAPEQRRRRTHPKSR